MVLHARVPSHRDGAAIGPQVAVLLPTSIRRATSVVALLGVLTVSACLEVDPGFVGFTGSWSNSTAITTDPHVGTDSSSGLSGSGNNTWTDQTSSTSTSTVSTSVSDEQSSDTSSSSLSSMTDSEETTSSDMSTDTVTTTEIEPDVVRTVRITNRSGSYPITANSSLQLVLNHQALVSAGADPDGRDFRLVYTNDQGERTILPRVLDFDSAWNENDTKVWFAPASQINAGNNDATHYTLEIGGGSGTADDDPDGVFLFWDDFGDSSSILTKWSVVTIPGGEVTVDDGILDLRVTPVTGQTTGLASVRALNVPRSARAVMEVKSRLNRPVDALSCRFGAPANFALNDNTPFDSILVGEGGVYAYYLQNLNSPMQVLLTSGIANNQWHQYRLDLRSGISYQWQDNVWIGSHTWVMDPATNFHYPRISAEMPATCGLNDTMLLETDWVRLRESFDQEPRVELL